MKKITHYIPHTIFALILLGTGVFGTYFGNQVSLYVFETLGSMGAWGYILRAFLMVAEIFAALGVFFILTRRSAASVGILIMLAFTFLSIAVAEASPILPVVALVTGVWILFMGYGCQECSDGSCMICHVEMPSSSSDISEE